MANPSNYPPELLRSAAAFDPAVINRMNRWKVFYQPGGHENNLLDRLIVEAQGGAAARLPEAVHFAAAKGDERAMNAVGADARLRDALIGELIGEFDPAAFEKFKARQRATATPSLESRLLQPNGPVGKATTARQQLLDALNSGR